MIHFKLGKHQRALVALIMAERPLISRADLGLSGEHDRARWRELRAKFSMERRGPRVCAPTQESVRLATLMTEHMNRVPIRSERQRDADRRRKLRLMGAA